MTRTNFCQSTSALGLTLLAVMLEKQGERLNFIPSSYDLDQHSDVSLSLYRV
jgi:hypothetical protein